MAPNQYVYHANRHPRTHLYSKLQMQPQICDKRTGAINYNYTHPYLSNQTQNTNCLCCSQIIFIPRRTRTRFTVDQKTKLEQHFLHGMYLSPSQLHELSAKLALGTTQVKIWFKNRRRRHKIQAYKKKEVSMLHTVSRSVKSEAHRGDSSLYSFSGPTSGSPNLNCSSFIGSNISNISPTPTTNQMINPSSIINCQTSESSHVSLVNASAGAQYYPPSLPSKSLQQHQQQLNLSLPHQFQLQHKSQDTNCNYKNLCFRKSPKMLTGNSATATQNCKKFSQCNASVGGNIYAHQHLKKAKNNERVLTTNFLNEKGVESEWSESPMFNIMEDFSDIYF